MGPIDWQTYAQGEYVGHSVRCTSRVIYLRVDDLLEIVYRLNARTKLRARIR